MMLKTVVFPDPAKPTRPTFIEFLKFENRHAWAAIPGFRKTLNRRDHREHRGIVIVPRDPCALCVQGVFEALIVLLKLPAQRLLFNARPAIRIWLAVTW